MRIVAEDRSWSGARQAFEHFGVGSPNPTIAFRRELHLASMCPSLTLDRRSSDRHFP